MRYFNQWKTFNLLFILVYFWCFFSQQKRKFCLKILTRFSLYLIQKHVKPFKAFIHCAIFWCRQIVSVIRPILLLNSKSHTYGSSSGRERESERPCIVFHSLFNTVALYFQFSLCKMYQRATNKGLTEKIASNKTQMWALVCVACELRALYICFCMKAFAITKFIKNNP